MRRLLHVVSAIAVLTGLEFYYANFIVPKRDTTGKVTMAVTTGVIDTGEKSPDHLIYVLKKKKYVWIDQKWYHFNPEHVYLIQGVPTLFIRSRSKKESKAADAGTLVWDQKIISNLNRMLINNPLKVYTPTGMKALVDAAKATQKEMQARTAEIDSQTQ